MDSLKKVSNWKTLGYDGILDFCFKTSRSSSTDGFNNWVNAEKKQKYMIGDDKEKLPGRDPPSKK